MDNRKIGLITIMAFAVIVLAGYVNSAIQTTDNLGVPVPAANGTSSNLNISARMQQYVGYFGNVVTMVRLNTTNASGSNLQLYNKSITTGKIYFAKSGATLTGAITPAMNNSQTDGNFSLTGVYITGNHFIRNGTICGVASVDHLNTTDNYGVGIFKDAAADPNYFLCTDILTKTSNYGFGSVGFEAVVPKTSTYAAYDVYIDLE